MYCVYFVFYRNIVDPNVLFNLKCRMLTFFYSHKNGLICNFVFSGGKGRGKTASDSSFYRKATNTGGVKNIGGFWDFKISL